MTRSESRSPQPHAPQPHRASLPASIPASTPTTTTLVVGSETVLVTRKTIKNMYLRIRPDDGTITVSAPRRTTNAAIRDFVCAHESWIGSTRERMTRQHRENEVAAFGHETDETLTPRELFHRKWTPERSQAARGYLQARVPEMIERWGRVLGRTPTSVTYRAMTSRWGSCTPATGRMRLNLELAEMPEALIEYVVVHEMVHLWEPRHGAGFHNRMSAVMPDWRERARTLNSLWRYA